MTRRLDEINKFYQDATWGTDKEYIEHTCADIPWLIRRVEQLESHIKKNIEEYKRVGIKQELRGDLLARPMSTALIQFAEEALAEEDE